MIGLGDTVRHAGHRWRVFHVGAEAGVPVYDLAALGAAAPAIGATILRGVPGRALTIEAAAPIDAGFPAGARRSPAAAIGGRPGVHPSIGAPAAAGVERRPARSQAGPAMVGGRLVAFPDPGDRRPCDVEAP